MAITVERTTEPQYPGEWTVMDDGICYSRHDTKEEAIKESEILAQLHLRDERVEDLLDAVHSTLMTEFNLTGEDARKAIEDWI